MSKVWGCPKSVLSALNSEFWGNLAAPYSTPNFFFDNDFCHIKFVCIFKYKFSIIKIIVKNLYVYKKYLGVEYFLHTKNGRDAQHPTIFYTHINFWRWFSYHILLRVKIHVIKNHRQEKKIWVLCAGFSQNSNFFSHIKFPEVLFFRHIFLQKYRMNIC